MVLAIKEDSGVVNLIRESNKKATPSFWFSSKRIKHNYQRFIKGFPGIKVYFPPKVNSNTDVLKVIAGEGSNFDAASLGEINLLLKLKVSPDKIIFTTPVKSGAEIGAAHKKGIKVFVADALPEIDKLAKFAPGSKVLVRIQTSNKGSQWPLSRRFGIKPNMATQILQYAADMKLIPYGVCFHVGSQCTSLLNWKDAIRHSLKIFKDFEKKSGIKLSVLDMGGGFPVCYTKTVPSLDSIFELIRKETTKVREWDKNVEFWVEPGRAIVADAAFATSTIIGRTRRGRDNWLFCDLGVFNGLLELIEPSSKGFRYEIYAPSPKNGKSGNGYTEARNFILTGPSCDGDDIIEENIELPNVGVGDRIFFLKVGAYSFAYGSKFCGNVTPKVFVV